MYSISLLRADSNNPFLDLFRNHFSDSYYSDNSFKSLSSYKGDSIYFEIQGNYPLTNITQEISDTLWLKDKLPKKPKEGKHYILNYTYKGIPNGKSFFTHPSDFNKKTFFLLSVKEINDNSYYSSIKGYDLSLVEPESLNIIHVVLDETLPSEWRLYSLKDNALIQSWLGNTFYYKKNYSDIIPYTFTSGEIYLGVEPGKNNIKYTPNAEFILTAEGNSPIEYRFTSSRDTYNLPSSDKFISLYEYQAEQEAKKVYEIDYTWSIDTVNTPKLDILPYKKIIGVTNKYFSYISQTVKPGYSPLGNKTLDIDTQILIGGKIRIRDNDYYMAALNGKAFYINCDNVNVIDSDNLKDLLSQPQAIQDEFFNLAKVLSFIKYHDERNELYEVFKKYADRGFVVIEAHPYDMSEYTDGTGMQFEFLNTSNQIIKYITISYSGYNAVDDIVTSFGKRTLTAKCIGPIEPYETGSYDFEYVWFSDIVDYSKIHSITVQYKNGTTRTYKGEAVKAIPDSIIESIKLKNPVEDFLPNFDGID